MNITLSVNKELSEIISSNKYIKWTEIAREAIKQKAIGIKKNEIFNKYIKGQELSKEEYQWLEKIDWHPVDELPIKSKYVQKLKNIEKNYLKKNTQKTMSKKELDNLFKAK